MDKIKTGLAAFGMSGQIFHAPFISTNPAFELTAVTERSKELSKERYPEARIVRSFEELIALDELELIVVNTPDSTHYEYARQALEAGKNVIVEKPFTTAVEQGQELVDLARSKGLAISVYQNRRWDSDFLTVREVLDKGLLGRLVELEGNRLLGGRLDLQPGSTCDRSGGSVVRCAGSGFCRYRHHSYGRHG